MIAFEQHEHRYRKTSKCQCISDLHISYEQSSELHVLLHTEHNTEHAGTLALTFALLHETVFDVATTMTLTNATMELTSYSAISKSTNIYSVSKLIHVTANQSTITHRRPRCSGRLLWNALTAERRARSVT